MAMTLSFHQEESRKFLDNFLSEVLAIFSKSFSKYKKMFNVVFSQSKREFAWERLYDRPTSPPFQWKRANGALCG